MSYETPPAVKDSLLYRHVAQHGNGVELPDIDTNPTVWDGVTGDELSMKSPGYNSPDPTPPLDTPFVTLCVTMLLLVASVVVLVVVWDTYASRSVADTVPTLCDTSRVDRPLRVSHIESTQIRLACADNTTAAICPTDDTWPVTCGDSATMVINTGAGWGCVDLHELSDGDVLNTTVMSLITSDEDLVITLGGISDNITIISADSATSTSRIVAAASEVTTLDDELSTLALNPGTSLTSPDKAGVFTGDSGIRYETSASYAPLIGGWNAYTWLTLGVSNPLGCTMFGENASNRGRIRKVGRDGNEAKDLYSEVHGIPLSDISAVGVFGHLFTHQHNMRNVLVGPDVTVDAPVWAADPVNALANARAWMVALRNLRGLQLPSHSWTSTEPAGAQYVKPSGAVWTLSNLDPGTYLVFGLGYNGGGTAVTYSINGGISVSIPVPPQPTGTSKWTVGVTEVVVDVYNTSLVVAGGHAFVSMMVPEQQSTHITLVLPGRGGGVANDSARDGWRALAAANTDLVKFVVDPEDLTAVFGDRPSGIDQRTGHELSRIVARYMTSLPFPPPES